MNYSYADLIEIKKQLEASLADTQKSKLYDDMDLSYIQNGVYEVNKRLANILTAFLIEANP